MTIHCYFGDYTSHKNEKKMLDQFLSQLVPHYGDPQAPWIYVIYNAIWNGQEVDLVCITQKSVIVSDFKNYSGSLTGQENGEWLMHTLDGEVIPVKGGSQINPFVQVRKNRYAIMDWLKTNDHLQNDNMSHMAGLIIFTELSHLKTRFSHSVNRWFHVSDTPNIASTISSISSHLMNIAESEADDVVKALNLQPYSWNPTEPISPRFNPFDNSSDNEANLNQPRKRNIKRNEGINYNPVSPPLSKKKHILIPLVTAVMTCAVIAGVAALNHTSLRDKALDFIVSDTDSKINSTLNFFFNTKSLQLINTSQDALAYGDNPESITEFNEKEPIWTTFQLLDLKKKTFYGFKVGETTFNEAKAKQIAKKYDNDVTEGYPYKTLESYSLYSSINRKYNSFKLHKEFPPLHIPNLVNIKMWFDANDKLRAIDMRFEDGERDEILSYLKRYKSLNYKVLEGSISKSIGYSYAVLNNDDDYVVLKTARTRDLTIIHTNKETFDQHRYDLTSRTFGSNFDSNRHYKL